MAMTIVTDTRKIGGVDEEHLEWQRQYADTKWTSFWQFVHDTVRYQLDPRISDWDWVWAYLRVLPRMLILVYPTFKRGGTLYQSCEAHGTNYLDDESYLFWLDHYIL